MKRRDFITLLAARNSGGANCYLLPSFGFEFQGPCSAFTSWRARKRDPKTFSLAAHNQEPVLGHVTFVLQQLFQISLERGLCFNHRMKDFLTSAGKSSASMFCHFNSSRAIVLLQLGRTKRAYAIHLNAIKRLLQEDGYAARGAL